ncbi:MAG: CDP-alcohol phosphatidyltransferase family protein [Roseiflexaceae bacterium]
MNVRSLPNLLGVFRIITTPLLVVFILNQTAIGYSAAAMLLLLMAISDIVDGKLARKLQVVSPLGVFLDTTSDKIFVAATLIPLVQIQLLPGWIAIVIIVRDFLISGLRSYAGAEGVVIPSGQWGKQKLTLTVTALIWLLVDATVRSLTPNVTLPEPLLLLTSIWYVPMGLALVWTVFSGLEYLWNARTLLTEPRPPAAPEQPRKSSVK